MMASNPFYYIVFYIIDRFQGAIDIYVIIYVTEV